MPLRCCPRWGVRSRIPDTNVFRHTRVVSRLVVGYARTSLFGDDAQQQRAGLLALGAASGRVYLDAGLVGMTRPRPALGETLAALRSGDTLVVTALFRLARSTTDAAALVGRLIVGEVRLVVGDVHHPMDGPELRLLVEGLEVAYAVRSARHSWQTKEGLRTVRATGQLEGRPPKMSPSQEQVVVQCYLAGRYGASDLGELFGVSRSTVYRALRRAKAAAAPGL